MGEEGENWWDLDDAEEEQKQEVCSHRGPCVRMQFQKTTTQYFRHLMENVRGLAIVVFV
jgi:hypothetical protein